MYQTGNIIKARVNKLPFIYHYGIIVMNSNVPVVLHFSPNDTNSGGGNLLMQSLDVYLKTRTLISVSDNLMTSDEIETAYNEWLHLKFNLFTRNCEHFVTKATTGTAKSKQLQLWTTIITILIITLIYAIKTRKK